ncbi:MAG: hypothetical protein CR981_03820 [Proteobacteria bacterium]|nr:MAG: hypothetical protein CR981_03820 [Pseudomonadota bacterium]
MNNRKRVLISLLTFAFLFFLASYSAGESYVIDEVEDSVPGEEGMTGINVIDAVSWEEGIIYINDMRFNLAADLILIDGGREGASPSLFKEGVQVIWTAINDETIVILERYPLEEEEEVVEERDHTWEERTGESPDNAIILGPDGVYRN